MRLLAEDFTHDGFVFHQLARDGDVVLLEKSKPGHTHPGYEVVIVQRHPTQTIHGREYPARESMPQSESWGVLGWSLTDLNFAKTRFTEIVTTRGKGHSLPTPFPADTLGAVDCSVPTASASASPREKG